MRKDEGGTNKHTPAPSTYQILGDFDFKDQSRPKGDVLHERGKNPKFCFGIKPNIKNMSIDFPGPAEYDTD